MFRKKVLNTMVIVIILGIVLYIALAYYEYSKLPAYPTSIGTVMNYQKLYDCHFSVNFLQNLFHLGQSICHKKDFLTFLREPLTVLELLFIH